MEGQLGEAVKLPPNMDERIGALWRSQPVGTDSLRFALAVSDDNFLPMIDPGLRRSGCSAIAP